MCAGLPPDWRKEGVSTNGCTLSLTPAQASWPLAAASCRGVDMDHLSPARTLALAAIRSCTCRAGKGEPAGGGEEGWIEWGGTTGKGVKSQ